MKKRSHREWFIIVRFAVISDLSLPIEVRIDRNYSDLIAYPRVCDTVREGREVGGGDERSSGKEII